MMVMIVGSLCFDAVVVIIVDSDDDDDDGDDRIIMFRRCRCHYSRLDDDYDDNDDGDDDGLVMCGESMTSTLLVLLYAVLR